MSADFKACVSGLRWDEEEWIRRGAEALRQVEENAYQRGQEAMRKRAAALVAALYDEFPGQHDYLKGGQLALDLAEQRIRALEVEP